MASTGTTPIRSRIQVPLQKLTKDHTLPTGPNDPDAVLGVWATASRQKFRTLNADGSMSACGPWQQVSRLGNPLINEVIIPTTKKDYWNSQKPSKRLAVREVLPGAGAHRGGQRAVRRAGHAGHDEPRTTSWRSC